MGHSIMHIKSAFLLFKYSIWVIKITNGLWYGYFWALRAWLILCMISARDSMSIWLFTGWVSFSSTDLPGCRVKIIIMLLQHLYGVDITWILVPLPFITCIGWLLFHHSSWNTGCIWRSLLFFIVRCLSTSANTNSLLIERSNIDVGFLVSAHN